MIAFVFPGQGAQYVGMGVELAGKHVAARRVFDEASAAIGLDMLSLCRDGPEGRLRETANTQPAILTCSQAVASVLAESGITPGAAAGLSLGEYSALVAAGAFTFPDAVAVVRKRGQFMHDAAEHRHTAMVAVLGLPAEKVVEICEQVPGFVEPANFNAPGQVVIGGDVESVHEAGHRLKKAGARRVISLAVSAPFHTSVMRPAAERLAEVLDAIEIREAGLPVIANVSAAPVRTPVEIRAALVAQVASPVRWEQSVQVLRQMGVSTFVEVGPGTTLAGLIKKTVVGVTVISVEDQATLETAQQVLFRTVAAGGREAQV